MWQRGHWPAPASPPRLKHHRSKLAVRRAIGGLRFADVLGLHEQFTVRVVRRVVRVDQPIKKLLKSTCPLMSALFRSLIEVYSAAVVKIPRPTV